MRVTALLVLAGSVAASIGDRSPAYQRCLSTCTAACPTTPPTSWFQLWPCPAECSYECLTMLTELALAVPSPTTHEAIEVAERMTSPGGPLEGLPVRRQVQYHGKWPFVRYWGMQELLSVIFSLANLHSHYFGLRLLLARQSRSWNTRTLRRDYILNAIVGINGWVWSAVFHTRDTPWTEKGDYFSAAMSTLYGLWLAIDRFAGFYKSPTVSVVLRHLIRTALGLTCLSHIAYLSRGRFDYGYNMQFNVVVGVSQIAIWTIWAVLPYLRPRSQRPPHHLKPLVPAYLMLSLVALELFDFAPVPQSLRLLDAHALWHASTVFVVRVWYRFLAEDLDWIEIVPEDVERARRDI